ncbi:AraC family transcriptional regulator [Kingella denitrificans]|uniref:AraC family transcriptional regulator n=1 Tax=Kingella denitrificans TaxID=502 RepID=UPI0028D4E034|nr:AraC family transcriptional regulator [Kingella denitrificans]
MDTLDKLIELAQITGSVDIQCLFRDKWYAPHERRRAHGIAHLVIAGESYIKIEGESEARRLKAGDLIFFPRSAEHVLSSEAACNNCGDTPHIDNSGAFTVASSNSGGEKGLDLFCARFEYDEHADIMHDLPETVLIRMNHPSLQCLVSMLQYESAHTLSGSRAIVNALSSVLLVLIVRAYLEQGGEAPLGGILNGLRDKRLRQLIQTVVSRPEDEWNIEKMTELANLSRAQLMRLFKQQTGISPHAFVNLIRLRQAAVLLRQTADSVLSIALNVGFQSETHFGKAFKKQYGISPGQYRKNEAVDTAALPLSYDI